MSFLPTPYTVQHLAYVEGATDAHGNPIQSWADPVDVPVYGWGAPQSEEPKRAGYDRTVVDLLVLGPPGLPFDSKDKAVVEGKTYRVIGEVEDYNHGPFGWKPGDVVNLQRVED